MLKFVVGTTSTVKINALIEALDECFGDDYKLYTIKTSSGVSEQPMTESEGVTGAQNRARSAYRSRKCDYGVGIEAGIRQITEISNQDIYMEQTYIAVYDGAKYYYGISPAWQIPSSWIKLLVPTGNLSEKRRDLNEVARLLNLTGDNRVGDNEGMVGLQTRGLVNREEYTRQGLMMVLPQLMTQD